MFKMDCIQCNYLFPLIFISESWIIADCKSYEKTFYMCEIRKTNIFSHASHDKGAPKWKCNPHWYAGSEELVSRLKKLTLWYFATGLYTIGVSTWKSLSTLMPMMTSYVGKISCFWGKLRFLSESKLNFKAPENI